MLIFLGVESRNNVCCDPEGQHKQPITKNLRKITAKVVLNHPELVFGAYWCDNCRKRICTIKPVALVPPHLPEFHNISDEEVLKGTLKHF